LNQKIKIKSENCITGNPNDIRKAKILVDMLSNDRADSYNKWIEVGWCLRSIDDDLFDTWVNFSMRNSDKFDINECKNYWNKAREITDDKPILTLGSLYMWAKEDNPKEFLKFQQQELKTYIENSITGTSADVAQVVYQKYKYQYTCASIKHKLWYEFKDHRWIPIESGHSLYRKLSEEVSGEYLNQATLLGNQLDSELGDGKDKSMDKQSLATKVSIKLRTTSFKKDVLHECMTLFYDPKFFEKLDEQRSLLGFNNGVYDLSTMQFRDGRPEDYISYSTNIDYIPYDENDDTFQEIHTFISELQPEDDMKNYIMDLSCSCLQGHTPDEKFHIWTGSGCFEAGTRVMMYDGTIKNVEDIVIGDQLMGDDGTVRNVSELFRGISMMYNVKLEDGFTYRVNDEHNLIFKLIKDCQMGNINEIISIRVKDYLKLINSPQQDEIIDSLRWIRRDNIERLLKYTITESTNDNFYGFELDRNHLFLGEDFSVLSNSNGKSLYLRLFMLALGDYAATVSSTFLTQKRAASHAASPDLARTKGKRFVALNEPEGNDQIYVGRMKEMSGGDPIVARQLYKEPVEFIPQFKMLLLCNDLPHIPSNDGGTWRRIRVVPFEMKFVDNPKKSYERKIDRGLKEKLDLWKEHFMSILIERFKIYKKQGLVEPVKVVKFTKDYEAVSDIYQQFIDEFIIITKKEDDTVSIKDSYSDFKFWFKEAHSDKKLPSRTEFAKELEKKFDRPTKGEWYGMKLKNSQDDDSEDDKFEEENKKKKNKMLNDLGM
jgi:P4 family phage/plasmid primase-like protien